MLPQRLLQRYFVSRVVAAIARAVAWLPWDHIPM
jgi:hypothetical protein